MLLSPYAAEVAQAAAEEGVKVITTGAGNPEKYMELWKNAGARVIPVVASVALAKRMERCGADAVIAEGCESGGHIGESTTMTLLPQVADAVDIPVIGAGGAADGRGIAAMIMLGAEAVQMGTRFVASTEAQVHDNYKNRILAAKDIDSVVTGRSTGHPVRLLRNQMTREYLELEKQGASFEELEMLTLTRCVDYQPTDEAVSLCGFDAPAAQMEAVYSTEGGAEQTFFLTVGAQSLDGSGRYIRLGGDPTIYEATADSLTHLLAIAAGGLEG